MTKKAIVTLAVGAAFAERFEQLCRRNWSAYAERHGFDLVIIKDPLDSSDRAQRRSPAWQKCLIFQAPGVADYERVVWVDSDVLLNPGAPSILDGVPPERVGVTDEHAYPAPEARQDILRAVVASAPDHGALGGKSYWAKWHEPGLWHEAMGLPGGQGHIVQTGVMVLSPKHHRAMLEHVYYAYEDGGLNYEMRFLSHEILAQGLAHWIDPKFNALVWWLFLQANMGGGRVTTQDEIRRFVNDAYARNYFLHFAGAANLMPLVYFTGS